MKFCIILFVALCSYAPLLLGDPRFIQSMTSTWDIILYFAAHKESKPVIVFTDIDGTLISEEDIPGSYITTETFLALLRHSIGIFGCTNRSIELHSETQTLLHEFLKLPQFGFSNPEWRTPEFKLSFETQCDSTISNEKLALQDFCLYLNASYYFNSPINNKLRRIRATVDMLKSVFNIDIKTVIFVDNDPKNFAYYSLQLKTLPVEQVFLVTFLPECANIVQPKQE